jgi:hypothetical protein
VLREIRRLPPYVDGALEIALKVPLISGGIARGAATSGGRRVSGRSRGLSFASAPTTLARYLRESDLERSRWCGGRIRVCCESADVSC